MLHDSAHFVRNFSCGMLLLGACLFPWPAATQAQTSSAIGQVIYDNSAGNTPDFLPSSQSQEYGDEVLVKAPPAGQSWILTDFLFEYFGDFTAQGDEKIRVRLYKNDGPDRCKDPKTTCLAPGTLLYDSGEFLIVPGYQTVPLSGLALAIPNPNDHHLTWTVQFSGLRDVKGDRAGLLLRNPPTVGRSFKDFWINDSNGWGLHILEAQNPNLPVDPVTNPDPIENFACRVIALVAAPPSSSAKLNIQRKDDDLVIDWNGPGRLQVSETAQGSYTDVPGAGHPHNVKVNAASQKFWRIVN